MYWIWFWLIGKEYAENAIQGISAEGYRYIYKAAMLWMICWIASKIIDNHTKKKKDNNKDKGDM